MTRLRVLVLLAGTSIFSCAGAHNVRDVTAAQTAAYTVVQTRQGQMEEQVLELAKQVKQVQDALRARGRNEAEALENIEQVAESIRALQGSAEELRFELDDLKAAMDAYQKQQEVRQLHDEQRLRQIERSLGLTAPPRPVLDGTEQPGVDDTDAPVTDGGGDTDEVEPPAELPGTAREKLDLAIEHMKAGRQGVARYVLEKGVKEHKRDPLAAEMRYRIAETWFNEGNYAKAASAFQEVLNNHRRSTWVPWAMLRQGESFKELGMKDEALFFLEDLERAHPKSEAANEARELMREIRKDD